MQLIRLSLPNWLFKQAGFILTLILQDSFLDAKGSMNTTSPVCMCIANNYLSLTQLRVEIGHVWALEWELMALN